MAYLGEKLRSEAVRLHLALDTAPTGTPQVAVEKNGTSILAATNMTQGASTLEWYYDYTTGAAATIGAYQIKYSAVVDGVTRYAYDQYDISVNSVDDVHSNTQTIITNLNVSSGARAVVFNVKDGGANPVEGVKLSVHNALNDDSPIYGQLVTDGLGDTATINLDDATYKVRVSKAAAIISSVETAVVAASGTKNLTVTPTTINNPADPDLCRLYLFPITLGNADITDLATSLTISGRDALTKVNGEFVKNAEMTFTYDSTTTPDSYYFDAVQGALVHITCIPLGIDHDVTVPAEAVKDLNDLIA